MPICDECIQFVWHSISSHDRYHGCARQGPGQDPAAVAVVTHLLADYDRPGAHEFALAWLHALFAAQPQRPPATLGEAAAGPSEAPADGQTAGAPGSTDSPAAVGGSTILQQGSSSEAAADKTAPSAYESVLLALLEGLRCFCFWRLMSCQVFICTG